MKRIVIPIAMVSIVLWNFLATAQTSSSPRVSVSLHRFLDVAAVATQSELKFIDVTTGNEIHRIFGFESLGYDLAWDPTGTMLAVTDAGQVEVWIDPLNPQSAEPINIISYLGVAEEPQAESYVRSLAWSPNSTQIAIAVGGYVSLWNVTDANLLLEVGDSWTDIRDNEISYFAEITKVIWPETDKLIFADISGGVFVYSIADETVTRFAVALTVTLEFPFSYEMALSNSKFKVAFSENTGNTIYIWDMLGSMDYDNFMSLGSYNENTSNYILTLAWRQDDQVIASLGNDLKLHLWDPETGHQYDVITLPSNASVYSLAWTHDGAHILYGTIDGEIGSITSINLPLVETPNPSITPINTLHPTPSATATVSPTFTPTSTSTLTYRRDN